VVINLGETQGVRLGMPFVVIHGDRIVGRVKVVEVRRKISGAVIEQMDRQAPIQVGDRVRVTKS
jgi:cell shape-determining protein MreC